MEQETLNLNATGVETALNDTNGDGSINSSPKGKHVYNRPLHLKYDKIIKLFNEQEENIASLQREVDLLKRVIRGRK